MDKSRPVAVRFFTLRKFELDDRPASVPRRPYLPLDDAGLPAEGERSG